ncbi:MAG: hypothetical protein CMA64_08550 [Euryarchaeota archaeon]|jgi:hypothetical protein|nr:hypothetical protein [Euryarchaeota archaeon]
MKLFELNQQDDKFYDPTKDDSVLAQGDTRKSKLTLGQLNSLRKMYDAKKFEKSKMVEKIKAQYGQKESDDSGL